ncbi:hypothetical protein [Rouxiella sp. Mn2063]|uniref:hypothetical protein n=1 Tax=Rouxiella sp. Mn2063 TaxID=3395262 RepID=UPI003BCEF564
MDTTKQREEFDPVFEKHIADYLGHTLEYVIGQRNSAGGYSSEYVENPRKHWQAAIASIEIELPERKCADYFADESFSRKDLAAIHNVTVEQCKVRVTAAGLRVKS